jgi:hypothetical protein
LAQDYASAAFDCTIWYSNLHTDNAVGVEQLMREELGLLVKASSEVFDQVPVCVVCAYT